MNGSDHSEYLPSTSRPEQGDEFDALADLFLGDAPLAPPVEHDRSPEPRSTGTDPVAARAPAPRQAPMRTARLEGVVLGHLPVRASIWVRQYAGSVADATQSPVALLRVSPDSTSLELVGAGVRQESEHESLRDAIAEARRRTAHWIVRVEETDEPALIARDDLHEITVLTGADEAAVVASYRLMKSVASDWDRTLDEDEGPALGLAIMGARSEEALAAGEKLERAARAFLQRPVQVSARVPRIGAVGSATLFRGETGETLDTLIAHVTGAAQEPGQGPRLRLAAEPERRDPPRVRTRRIEPVRTPPVSEAPASTTPAKGAAPASMSSLLPGLTTLETRCPKAGRVELATDEDGRLHLIARSGADPTQPIDTLIATSAWAREHLALLLRAEPTLAAPSADPSSDSSPVLHLVTTEPKLIRPLLDADVRVHLLTEIEVAGQTARVLTELN